jgi:hypothetical protein
MARDFLAAPVASACVERRFSLSGHVLNKKRNRLTSEHLEELLLLNDWKRNKF